MVFMRKTRTARRRLTTRKPIRRMNRRRTSGRNPAHIGGPNTCKIVETFDYTDVVPNQPYRFEVDGIIPNTRAAAVAEQFGLYRVAKVILKYKPTSDTFTSNPAFIGGAGAATVPYLYWKMNRFADAPAAFNADDLKNMGAKAFRLDDKTITVAYKPNILLGNASAGSVSGQLKMTPWLNTDAAPDTPNFALSTTQHYGHFYTVECATNGAGTTAVATLEATVIYEFKNPRVKYTASSAQTVKATPQIAVA